MFRALLFLIFVSIGFGTLAQVGQKPIFKSKADSAQLAKIQKMRATFDKDHPDADLETKARVFDSLSKVELPLLRKATWQYVYGPRKSFTSYGDLKSGAVSPDSVTQLSISGLRSGRVPAEVLKCKNLEELELVNTRIDELQSELSSLAKLATICLYNNVPSKRLILGTNNTVNYLRIAGNNPEKLPTSYKSFSGLDSLNLNRSNSVRFPNIKHNPELTKLMLVENSINLKRFKKSASLTYLDLRRNQVMVVPNRIRKFKSLQSLSFNTNPIKKVKPGLGKLNQLVYLSFYGDRLKEIPKPVYKLSNLQTIDLFHNEIEFLSPEIRNLQKLEVLYLANNKLYRLPDEIGELKNLQEVYVYNNRMDTLPASMDKLTKLRILWVNDNFFHTIPATAWKAGKLEYVDVSQNFISRVPDEIADAPPQTLILSGVLMNKERENSELFERLRKQGTRIIYYSAKTDVPLDDEEGP
ncbi:MAG TPA: leucine-rich repeat domain-containing protein [Cyclobacteriaceae bacterium]|nr:leucine-rich repeat domain-containing protein [Cyclobacteriaceae bacterium]HMV08935.1 leucine-rich repeat domain-containing protein [Cyclobacteriaceae bacterium]HMV90435.1 leucine-rich repeat domain-containing protein [Cyclobacteriaceae bacterium]HMX00310.1 leucine-rich repeat domain-containing protein [Cyclobacteriaceae bacterium]HMX49691.1 leucine-rich repeat domain-containing protein [Cyclobacteriaceae bacterium]